MNPLVVGLGAAAGALPGVVVGLELAQIRNLASQISVSVGTGTSLNAQVINEARILAESEGTAAGWRHLASHGDDYAARAFSVISEPGSFLGAVTRAYWDQTVGETVRIQKFDAVGQIFFSDYLNATAMNGFNYLNTIQIERTYVGSLLANQVSQSRRSTRHFRF